MWRLLEIGYAVSLLLAVPAAKPVLPDRSRRTHAKTRCAARASTAAQMPAAATPAAGEVEIRIKQVDGDAQTSFVM